MKQFNYTAIGILLMLLSQKVNAQNQAFFKNVDVKSRVESKINLSRHFFKTTTSIKKHNKVRPKLSVDVLDGKGIHVLTISKVNFLPTMRIGVEFNAKLLITI